MSTNGTRALRVAVAGGGIGGLTLALALRERGIDADVYEQAGELREIGAAVALSANGVRELERLGLREELAAISTMPTSLCVRRGDDGELLSRDPMGEDGTYVASFGAPYYGVHRVPLLELLASRMDRDRLHLGTPVHGADPDGTLHLEGADPVRADVVIAADGVHSVVRRALGFESAAQFSGTVGYRGVVDVERLPSLPEPSAIQFWAGPGAHLLHYAIDGGARVNFLAVVRVDGPWDGDTWMQPCEPAESAARFADWHPAVREMIGAVDESARCALHDHLALEDWHVGRVALMGDAAHAMLPHQGQGANQTIEDAAVLAALLAETDDVDAALAAYGDQRRARTARVQAYSRRVADLMHVHGDTTERDAAFADLPRDLAWIHAHDATVAAATVGARA